MEEYGDMDRRTFLQTAGSLAGSITVAGCIGDGAQHGETAAAPTDTNHPVSREAMFDYIHATYGEPPAETESYDKENLLYEFHGAFAAGLDYHLQSFDPEPVDNGTLPEQVAIGETYGSSTTLPLSARYLSADPEHWDTLVLPVVAANDELLDDFNEDSIDPGRVAAYLQQHDAFSERDTGELTDILDYCQTYNIEVFGVNPFKDSRLYDDARYTRDEMETWTPEQVAAWQHDQATGMMDNLDDRMADGSTMAVLEYPFIAPSMRTFTSFLQAPISFVSPVLDAQDLVDDPWAWRYRSPFIMDDPRAYTVQGALEDTYDVETVYPLHTRDLDWLFHAVRDFMSSSPDVDLDSPRMQAIDDHTRNVLTDLGREQGQTLESVLPFDKLAIVPTATDDETHYQSVQALFGHDQKTADSAVPGVDPAFAASILLQQ